MKERHGAAGPTQSPTMVRRPKGPSAVNSIPEEEEDETGDLHTLPVCILHSGVPLLEPECTLSAQVMLTIQSYLVTSKTWAVILF